jgi:hypothetical protein
VISHLLNDLGNDAQMSRLEGFFLGQYLRFRRFRKNNAEASIRHANRDDFVAVTPVNAEIQIQCEDLS